MKCSTVLAPSSVLLLFLALVAQAAEPTTLNVWPGKAPGEKGDVEEEKAVQGDGAKPVLRIHNVTVPTLTVYKPDAAIDTGAAVLICPGGGYNILAWDLEGTEVAEWLNSIGVTGIVLKYRVPRRKDREKHDAPLQDAQRALSLCRANADKWGVDPTRLGILGFSAGGHLSATTATNYDKRNYEPIDDVDKQSCRPDFVVLIYPAYLQEDGELTPEIRVDAKSPPTFFAHAFDDGHSPENSVHMFLALKKAKVPSEVHVYANGGHGFGLRPTAYRSSTWPKSCEGWLRNMNLLEKR
ncbi:MAG: alpha/beta hydrolase [Pirellulaceae bacterium]